MPAQVAPLVEQIDQLEAPEVAAQRADLCQQVLQQISSRTHPELWGDMQKLLAHSLAQMPEGNRADNIEQEIAAYQQALTIFTQATYPEDWAIIQYEVARLYRARLHGDKVNNIGQAIQIYQAILTLHTEATAPQKWALVQYQLGASYYDRYGNSLVSKPTATDDIDLTITAYKSVLRVYTRDRFPDKWGALQHDLSTAYLLRSQGDTIENANQAIACCEKALTVRTRAVDPEDWATTQKVLAAAHQARSLSVHTEDLETAIRLYQETLEVFDPVTSPWDWALVQHQLGRLYFQRQQGDKTKNLEQAIAAFEQALTVRTRSENAHAWANTQTYLANAHVFRIRGVRADNIETAIALYAAVLAIPLRTAYPKQWARTQHYLSAAYLERIRGERAENIERAIAACERALTVRTRSADPGEWALTQTNLAQAYRLRIQGDQANNVETAISLYEDTLTVYTRAFRPAKWAERQDRLASAYLVRIRGDRVDNIERAIAGYTNALEVYTRDDFPIAWANGQANLSLAYLVRVRGDRADNLEQAIAASQHALTALTHEVFPELWTKTQLTLAMAYCDRLRDSKAENLERAIAIHEQTLTFRTREAHPIQWASTQYALAIVYTARLKGDRVDNFERAIRAYEATLTVRTRKAFPKQWAAIQNALGNAYLKRAQWDVSEGQKHDSAEDFERAIAAYQQGLAVRTREAFPRAWAMTQHNLAVIYDLRLRGDRRENIAQAIACYENALAVLTPDGDPNSYRLAARHLANLYADRGQWSQAQTHYRTALTAAETLYQESLSLESETTELFETNDLYRRATYAQAKVGDLQTAIFTLEQGRARRLSETLQRDRADLTAIRRLNPELSDRYETAAATLRQLESAERRSPEALQADFFTNSPAAEQRLPAQSPQDLRQQIIDARQTLQACLTEIRQLPGHETFLTLPTFGDIAATLQPDQPLIYLLATPNGSLALVMLKPSSSQNKAHQNLELPLPNRQRAGEEGHPAVEITPIWLDQVIEAELHEWLYGPDRDPKLGGWFGAYENSAGDRAAWLKTLHHTTQKLWEPVMAKIVAHLSRTEIQNLTAALIPTGLFGFFPLHAAWTQDISGNRHTACDTITFTYAPNALSLQAARTIAAHTPATSLLAINDPQPTQADPLPSSGYETASAIANFPGKGNWQLCQHENATAAAVLEALPNHAVVHFSGHGTANVDHPLDSGLLMANDVILSLLDLLDLRLKGLRLAVLSACETGIPSRDLLDEVISLSTGLLQAGAAGVVSSLWPVAELSTMLMVKRFYDLWRSDGLEPAQALHQAQLWLRDSTGPELAPYLQPSHPDLATKFAQAPDKRPFAHPFYWAAFTYTGV